MEFRVGQKIRIVDIVDEKDPSRYIGKEGVITKVSIDPWGELRIDGTWAGIGLFPNKDTIEVLEE